MKINNYKRLAMMAFVKSIVIGILLAYILFLKANAEPNQCCIKPEPKPVIKTVYKQVKEPCCAKPAMTTADSKTDSKATSEANTGSQTITINNPVKVIKVKKVKYKTKVIRKYSDKPNRLQLLGGISDTKIRVKTDNCCNLTATKEHEFDLGIQYSRDFDWLTGSVSATLNRNIYLGLGINW